MDRWGAIFFFMATEQTQNVQIADTDPHDFIFHLPDQRASEFTFWFDNIYTEGLTLEVLLKRVGDGAELHPYEVGQGKLFELVPSLDGKNAILRNSNAITGLYDLGIRLTYASLPPDDAGLPPGTITLSAYADAGKL